MRQLLPTTAAIVALALNLPACGGLAGGAAPNAVSEPLAAADAAAVTVHLETLDAAAAADQAVDIDRAGNVFFGATQGCTRDCQSAAAASRQSAFTLDNGVWVALQQRLVAADLAALDPSYGDLGDACRQRVELVVSIGNDVTHVAVGCNAVVPAALSAALQAVHDAVDAG